MDINQKVAKKLREARGNTKQATIARRLNKTVDFISLRERGKRKISAEDLVAFSSVYKKPIIYFFTDLTEDY